MKNPLDEMPDFPAHKLNDPGGLCQHLLWDVQTKRVPESGVPEPSTLTCRHCGETRSVKLVFSFHKA